MGKSYSFDVDDAVRYGVHAAIILQNIKHWVDRNAAKDINFNDGRYWTHNSKRVYAELYPFMTERQIGYALKKLEKEGAILIGKYSNGIDRSSWFTLAEKASNKIVRCPKASNKIVRSILQNCKNNNIYKTTNIKHIDAPRGASVGFSLVSGAEGPYVQFAKELIEQLSKRRRIKRKPSIKKWSSDFKALIEKDNVSSKYVEFILRAHDEAADLKYCPQVFSAQAFRMKFNELSSFIEKNINTEASKPIGDLSSMEKSVVEQIRKFSWKNAKASEGLERAVVLSYRNNVAFVDAFLKLRAKAKKKTDKITSKGTYSMEHEAFAVEHFCDHLNLCWKKEQAVIDWFRELHKSKDSWAQWNGNIDEWIMDLQHAKFSEKLQKLARSYAGPQKGSTYIEIFMKHLKL